jgi:hypothetical protein
VGVRPPGVLPTWDDNGVETQAKILAFDQLADYDETKLKAALAGVKDPQLCSESRRR